MSAAAAESWAAAQAAGGESADQASAATATSPYRVPPRACAVLLCGRIGLPVTTRPDTLAAAPVPRLRRPLLVGFDHDAASARELPASHSDRIGAQYGLSSYRSRSKTQRRRTSSRTDGIAPSTRPVPVERFALPTGGAAALYPSCDSRVADVGDTTRSPQSQFIGQWRGPVTTDESAKGVVTAL